MAGGKVITIDGLAFSTLEEFFEVIGRQMVGSDYQGAGNLDWFNDVLFWPFEEGGPQYVLVWRNSDESRKRLGYEETIRQLERRGLERFPNGARAMSTIDLARSGEGPTVFDWLVEIITDNREYVELRLA